MTALENDGVENNGNQSIGLSFYKFEISSSLVSNFLTVTNPLNQCFSAFHGLWPPYSNLETP